jgi:hypothetical protein
VNLARVTGAIGLELIHQLYNSATLTFYSGTQPATPETALSGNTSLVVFTWSSTAFGTPTYGSSLMTATATFSSSTASPGSSGTTTFARATMPSTNWAVSHAYTYGTLVTNSSNFYICVGTGTSAGSGGPTTTAQGIVDGSATWNYVGATSGQGNVLADYTCGTSATDIILGTTTITTGTNVTISSFTQSIPVS